VTFTLTKKAADRLRRIRWRKKAEGLLRIIAENRGGAQWVLQMSFDAQQKGDEVTESQGVTVIMDRRTAKALDGMTVDYTRTGGKGTFVFGRSPAQ
jgi:iron-sulfur cluster assembly accessory protein